VRQLLRPRRLSQLACSPAAAAAAGCVLLVLGAQRAAQRRHLPQRQANVGQGHAAQAAQLGLNVGQHTLRPGGGG
jgi:hypothetical protein